MKILVCGDRLWTDKELIRKVLKEYPVDTIFEGEAPGADTLARIVAGELGITVDPYPALWRLYGNAAGPIRNRKMLDQKPDLVLAFHDNIKVSKGTADTIREARRRGIPWRIVSH